MKNLSPFARHVYLDLAEPLPRDKTSASVRARELAEAIERHNREVARLLADTDYRSVLTSRKETK